MWDLELAHLPFHATGLALASARFGVFLKDLFLDGSPVARRRLTALCASVRTWNSWRTSGVHTAEDGEEELSRPLKGGLDAIVLDLMLPVMDGVSVCEQLRNKGVYTPVLMRTGKTELEDVVRGFAVGADD